MARQAVLVGNSVTYLDTQKNVSGSRLRRVIGRFADLLTGLPGDYPFEVSTAIDETVDKVTDKIVRAAKRARQSNSLLLFYYFGHGALSEDYELSFVHPGRRKGQIELFKRSSLIYIFGYTQARKTLLILDCCYSAVKRTDEFGPFPPGEHCLLAATTPTALAYIHTSSTEPPMGAFTRAIMNGFFSPIAVVTATDYRITADSLFKFARQETEQLTGGVQKPWSIGHLTEAISEFVPKPEIIPGITRWANEKSGYGKLLAILRVLASRNNFKTVRDLYKEVLKRYRNCFLTLYQKAGGDLTYRPAHVTVLYRYIRFLRSVGIIAPEELRFSKAGLKLMKDPAKHYNQKLVPILDAYLESHGLKRSEIAESLRKILDRRGMPSRTEIFDDLALIGHHLPTMELGLILDLLGYTRAIRMTTDRVYFPW